MTGDWTVPKKDLKREHALLYFNTRLYYPIFWVQGFQSFGLARRVGFSVQEGLNP